MGVVSEFFVSRPADVKPWMDERAGYPSATMPTRTANGVCDYHLDDLSPRLPRPKKGKAVRAMKELWHGGDEGPWLSTLSDPLVEGLAGLDRTRLEKAAKGWAEEVGLESNIAIDLLDDLRALARLVMASNVGAGPKDKNRWRVYLFTTL